jgi:REP element-mobilizing transposase RayT
MTCARQLFVPVDTVGTYHCVSRCVRRAWLCGIDTYTGIDYSHRKPWVEQRLASLCEIFAIGLYGYAVMSNHLHVVVRVDPALVGRWTDADIATRWCRLFPARSEEGQALKVHFLLQQPERLALLRKRLADLSWFMRCLNEPLARAANAEDHCSGRFWEGRFKCQALLDERAVLTALAYVDLNPIRAGITTRLDHSHHTSIRQRVLDCRSDDDKRKQPLTPLLGIGPPLPLSQGAYIDLVQWTGQQVRSGKRGVIPKDAASALSKTGGSEKHWPTQVKAVGSGYWRVIGTAEQMMEKARQLGQCWLKGIGLARRLEAN